MSEARRRNQAGEWSNTFRAGRFTCTLNYQPDGGLKAEWSPDVPKAATFSSDDMVAYRRGRDSLLAEVSAALGGAVLVLEA